LIRRMAFVIALAPYAVVLLCDVDELKIDGKRANHADRLIQCEARKETLQSGLNRRIMPRTQLLAEPAYALFGPEQPLATQAAQGLAEQVAEQVYVGAQGNVFGLLLCLHPI
jgi:hypothetical protein